ncbi:MAG: hypothetical protein U1E76_26235 [Planctomycetota bacterium]
MIAPILLLAAMTIAQDEHAEDVTTIAYDLSGLGSISGHAELRFDLCPASPSGQGDHPAPEPQEASFLDVAHVQAWLAELARQRWGEGVVEVASTEQTLLVTGPTRAHEEITRLLERLEAACLGDERLQVRVLTGEGVLALPFMLAAAEADQRVAALVADGKAHIARAGVTCLIDGLVRTIDAADGASLVRDWDVEIAHGVAIPDPVMTMATTGLAASVRAARAAGGTYLDLALRYQEDDAPRDHTVMPTVRCASLPTECVAEAPPCAAICEPMPLLIEFPGQRFASWAGSLVLPDGQVLVIPCRVRTREGELTVAFELRVSGKPRQWIEPLLENDGATQATFVHLGALVSPGIGVDRLGPLAFENLLASHEREDEPAWPSGVESRAAHETDVTEILPLLRPDAQSEPATALEFLSPSHLVVQGPDEVGREIAAQLGTALGPGKSYEISGRILAGQRELAQFRVPAIAGRLTTLWSGFAGAFLADWDVDVADIAAIGNPQVDWLLDGFALRLRVQATAPGHAQLILRGKLHFLEARPAIASLANPYTPEVECVRAQSLYVDEVWSLGEGSGTIRCGDEHLAIEVTVRAVP